MAKKKKEFRDMDDKPIAVGSRVELHPGMDLWMRGARYGVVTAVRADKLCVRMDNTRVRKLVCVVPDRLKKVR
jgi:hypothetical protein